MDECLNCGSLQNNKFTLSKNPYFKSYCSSLHKLSVDQLRVLVLDLKKILNIDDALFDDVYRRALARCWVSSKAGVACEPLVKVHKCVNAALAQHMGYGDEKLRDQELLADTFGHAL